jgi:lipopolysaccharide export system permease protein
VGVLWRYLTARFFVFFAAVLFILVLALGVVELIGDFDDVIRAADGLLGALINVGLRILSFYLPLLVPAAAFVAAFASLGTAARALEILAMKAGGISPLRAVIPIVLAGVAISGIGLLLNETLVVRAGEIYRSRVRGSNVGQVTFRRGSFWYHNGPYVYNVGDADPKTRQLHDVEVYELNEQGRLVRSIEASRVEIGADGTWLLSDAVIRRFDPQHPAAAASYERVARTELTLHEENALLDAGLEALSIRQLREYRNGRRAGDPEATRAEALLHQRMTNPLSALVFVVLAIPLALRVEEHRSLALPALQGVAAIFVFFTVREYGQTLASRAITAPVGTAWAVLAVFGLFGAWQMWRVPR